MLKPLNNLSKQVDVAVETINEAYVGCWIKENILSKYDETEAF